MRALFIAALLILSSPALAWDTPARGTDLRADLMDALRPLAEWNFGAPVEFVVTDLRVSGDVAFANLYAQRPGGGTISMATTPLVLRDGFSTDMMDGPTIQALLQKEGRMWVAVHHGVSPTDVWWAWDGFCPAWRQVLPDICGK